MLAADPERLGARLRVYGEIRYQRRDRRRLGRRRRGRAAHDRFPGGLCAARRQARTRRAAGARLPVPHRALPRAGDPRGRTALRREHEDVRRIAPRAGTDRRADRGDARPSAGWDREIAEDRGCGEGRRLPRRPAGGHHRAAEGSRKALSRPRPRHLRNPARHPARRPARRPRPLRKGGDPRLPRHQDRRRGGVNPRVSRQGWASVPGSRHRDSWSEGKLTGFLAIAILYGMSDLTPELARLSPRQRLDLIEALWESLDDKDVPVTEAQRAELDRRIAGFEQDREQSISWDQLSAELRQRR